MTVVLWLLLLIGGALFLAYHRVSLRVATIVGGIALVAYSLIGSGSLPWMMLLWGTFIAMALLNVDALRMRYVTKPFLMVYRRMLPTMSDTEREALEAGTVWWDGELFTGKPDWPKLLSAKPPQLTAEEQAFIDGPCEELCRMLDEWDITHRRADLPPHVWDYLKKKGFFAMIISKKYGGLEFSAYAHSCVLVKLASRSATCSSTVAVPNSLGPAELLLHYGTEEQKNHYLPRLARGEDVPFSILLPAFVTSELKTAFQIGFMLFLPFLVIDLVVSSVLMSLGMMMMSPTIVSLPFKLLLFVLVDGWALLMGSLAASFG
jgi:acyl-CoA dehydrogenase